MAIQSSDDEDFESDADSLGSDQEREEDHKYLLRFFEYKDLHEQIFEETWKFVIQNEGHLDGAALEKYRNFYRGRFEKDANDPEVQFMYAMFRALDRFDKQNEFLKAMIFVVDDGTFTEVGTNLQILPLPGGKGESFGLNTVRLGYVSNEKRRNAKRTITSTGTLRIKLADPLPKKWTLRWLFDSSRTKVLRPPEDEGPTNETIENNLVACSWSPLFSAKLSSQGRFFMLHALLDADRMASVFTTCAGACFEETSWFQIRWGHWVSYFLDIVTVVLFLLVGFRVRDELQPERPVVYLLVVMSVGSIISMLTELTVTMLLFWRNSLSRSSASSALFKYLKGWSFLFVFLESYTAIVMLIAAGHTCGSNVHCFTGDAENQCWFVRNAKLMMAAVLVKCMFIVIKTLCYRPLGNRVFSAYATVFSSEVLAYSLFVFLLFCSAFFAYYILPIQENLMKSFELKTAKGMVSQLGKHGKDNFLGFHPIIKSLMKVFRLCFMGDYDLYELEGVDEVVNAQDNWLNSSVVKEGFTVAEIDDGDTTNAYLGILMFFIFGVSVNVILLNVYIGLISNVYNDKYAYRHQIFAEFRAGITTKKLIWKCIYEYWRGGASFYAYCRGRGCSAIEAEPVILTIEPGLGFEFIDIMKKAE